MVRRLVEQQQVRLPAQQAGQAEPAALPGGQRALAAMGERREQGPLLLGPAEVGPAIAFLGSPLNTGVTGELVRVSGGL